MSNNSIKSPLPDFTSGAQKIIEKAIEENDVDFFYRLYLTKMVELSMTGQGTEFIKHAKTALDNSENSLFMSKGFEAIGHLINCEFTKCSSILDELEESTQGSEIHLWVNQISNLCRAYIFFYNGDYLRAIRCAEVALASPIQSGTLDPLDKGRLIRLVCCIAMITSDIEKIDQCAIDINKIENPDDLKVLHHAKSAIQSMKLLAHGDYKKAFELAKATIFLEESLGRVGITSPIDCKFVLIRCLFEFSLLDEAIVELQKLKEESLKHDLKFIYYLCEVGEIRVLSRDPSNLSEISIKLEKLRDKILLDPNLKPMSWLVDLGELFVKGRSNDFSRIDEIVSRNLDHLYLRSIGKKLNAKNSLGETHFLKQLPESTTTEVITKYLLLSRAKSEGVKKQREYLKIALTKGEDVGAREIFLRQQNETLEAIVNLSDSNKSQWLESLSRSCLDQIKKRNSLLQFTGGHLTSRELEVLKYLNSDKSIEEIGKTLHISKNTMKTHLRNIYKKLVVKDRKQAAQMAKKKMLF
ncbi:MAG: response regulator transcription factor [Candidatus Nanopelagicus sp.]